jgi:nucleoside-diphosphate-sugar epimerase
VEEAGRLASMLAAEAALARFGSEERRSVILRFGLLWGPGTGNSAPVARYNASLHIEDAATALLLALQVANGIYNVVQDGGRVSADRFRAASGWTPRFQTRTIEGVERKSARSD